MLNKAGHEKLLKRINALGHEIEHLKRDLLRSLPAGPRDREVKATLFGSVRGGDVTEKMIEETKRSIFRSLEDI